MAIFGIRFIGLTAENGYKLLLTLTFTLVVLGLRWGIRRLASLVWRGAPKARTHFWLQQGVNLTVAALLLVGVVSIWFDDPARLTTAAGLVTAGLAFALQRVITSIAGYFVILRSRAFSVGDRILMGGVRGDVMALGFVQTTIMEMGQPPGERPDDPTVWVRSRQFTGRLVTVTNDKIFDEPVFNYTSDFPYLWEELTVPIAYQDNYRRAEHILLAAAERQIGQLTELSAEALQALCQRYGLPHASPRPQVYYRLTDNWLELTVRFIVRAHGIREVKDALSRDILAAFEAEGIGIASTTMAIVGLPPLRLEHGGSREDQHNHLQDPEGR
jgi:small-conductance mechanosensitive channel